MKDAEVVIISRFPPPYDGQTVAAQRLYSLLQQSHLGVESVNLRYTDEALMPHRSFIRRIRRVFAEANKTRSVLKMYPGALLIYNGLSASPGGHFRDVLFFLYAFQNKPRQRIWGIVHNGNYDTLFSDKRLSFSGKRLVDRLDKIILLSPVLLERMLPYVKSDKLLAIPNTVSDDILCANSEIRSKRQRDSLNDPLKILFLSNMHQSKGYLDLLQAIAILTEQRISVHLDLVGAWPNTDQKALFASTLSKLGIEKVVHHYGAISDRATIKQLLLNSDLFVLPTYYPFEAQPITIIEAFNAGLPVIATRHAAIPDMIEENYNGSFVDPMSPKDIAGKIEAMRNPETCERLSVGARMTFLEKYQPSVVKKQWLTVLSNHIG